MTPARHDVVVVGAGHNGLVAACYLARAGLDVAVVEAAPEIGGMTTTAAAVPGAPRHLVNMSAADIVLMLASGIIEDLGLARHGLRIVEIDPGMVYLHPDGASLAFWRDPGRTVEEIGRFSRADASAYADFVRMLDAMLGIGLPYLTTNPRRPALTALARSMREAGRHRHQLRQLGALASTTALGAVHERFEHPVVVSALLGMAATMGPIAAEASGLNNLYVGGVHRVGVGRPLGGMGALPAALGRVLAGHGATVRTSSAVEEITVADGRAVGVRLVDGTEIGARRAVVAACDPKTALLGLVPEHARDRVTTERARQVPTNAGGVGALRADVALSGRLALPRHQPQRRDGLDLRVPTQVIGTADEIVSATEHAAGGVMAEDHPMLTMVPTAVDPSQAPEGCDTLYVYVTTTPLKPHATWPTLRDRAEKTVLATASRYFEGIEELSIGTRLETPEEMARRLHVTDACFQHVDFAPTRLGPLRPALGLGGYRTPVAGLVLTGAGTHPGGGVSGISGRLAAEHLLRATRSR